MRHRAVGARHQRHRRQRRRLHQIVSHLAAGRLAQAQAVASVASGAGRPVPLTVGRMGQQATLEGIVVRKTTGGQQHPAAGLHRALALRRGENGTRDPPLLLLQADDRAVHANVDPARQRRSRQRRHQRIAIDQPQAAPMQQQVTPMPQQQLGHVPERSGLAQRVQEMPQLGTRGDPQTPQRGLGQRRFELVDAGTQARCRSNGRGAQPSDRQWRHPACAHENQGWRCRR